MSCAWPTSSCTFAVSASLRCSVGALRIHSRSGSTPINSLLPCISMNLSNRCRYSSGSQSVADLAAQLGVQKPSLYHHIASKEDLLWEVASDGAQAFHAALDSVPPQSRPTERI